MSERMDLHGKNAPPHVIEHGGRRYVIPHALDVGDLLAIEQELYQRAIGSLALQKSAMDPEDYRAELKALREKYDAGEFGFEQEGTQAVLKTRKGAMLFLAHVLKASEAELIPLLMDKGDELLSVLESVTKATFPDEGKAGPKAKPRPGRGARRRG